MTPKRIRPPAPKPGLPALAAQTPYEWVEVQCTNRDCRHGAVGTNGKRSPRIIGAVASFDSGIFPDRLLCTRCYRWMEIRCARCHSPLGHVPESEHLAPVVYCGGCYTMDNEAKEKRNNAMPVEIEP